jgi:type VI secretion system secreted protein VgrG
MPKSAEQNVMNLTSSAGEALFFKRMTANEELGKLFEFDVLGVAKEPAAHPDALLGTPACVSLQLSKGGLRHFHGLVCAIGIEGAVDSMYSYRLVLRPWLWLLTRRTDTRVFQKQNLVEILKTVFAKFSADFEFHVGGSLPTYEYCVQYRESDFNFVSRLMEQEGVYYYFKHSAGKHTMMIVNTPSAHTPGIQEKFDFSASAQGLEDNEPITDWRVRKEIQSDQVVLREFDVEKPSKAWEVKATGFQRGATGRPKNPLTLWQDSPPFSKIPGTDKLEVYDYPGYYAVQTDERHYSQLRLEELQARYSWGEGSGSMRAMTCGARFSLENHPIRDQNRAYVVVSTLIEFNYSGYTSHADDTFCTCHFSAIEATEVYRPHRSTPKPSVAGLHTAIVVGPKGDEIHTDGLGSVKVQFHWDRLGKNDENSSCFVRVATSRAGNGWGAIVIPRIGQEVVVDFLEGDPDRPLITGMVYNGEQLPPHSANPTISTDKSHSSKDGGKDNFNELRFEDKKDAEYVWFQAERDFHQLVKHDATLRVMGDQERIFEGKITEEVKAGVMVKVAGDEVHEIGGSKSLQVQNDLIIESSNAVSLKSGTDIGIKVGADLGIDAGANVHIKAGANLVIEAGSMLTLKAGGSTVVLGPMGVVIKGSMVLINSGGPDGSGSGTKTKALKNVTTPEIKEDPLK